MAAGVTPGFIQYWALIGLWEWDSTPSSRSQYHSLCVAYSYLLPSTPILGTASVVATDTLSLFLITCRYVARSEIGALTPLHGSEIFIMAFCWILYNTGLSRPMFVHSRTSIFRFSSLDKWIADSVCDFALSYLEPEHLPIVVFYISAVCMVNRISVSRITSRYVRKMNVFIVGYISLFYIMELQ